MRPCGPWKQATCGFPFTSSPARFTPSTQYGRWKSCWTPRRTAQDLTPDRTAVPLPRQPRRRARTRSRRGLARSAGQGHLARRQATQMRTGGRGPPARHRQTSKQGRYTQRHAWRGTIAEARSARRHRGRAHAGRAADLTPHGVQPAGHQRRRPPAEPQLRACCSRPTAPRARFRHKPFLAKDRESWTWLSEQDRPITDMRMLLVRSSYFALNTEQASSVLKAFHAEDSRWTHIALGPEVRPKVKGKRAGRFCTGPRS